MRFQVSKVQCFLRRSSKIPDKPASKTRLSFEFFCTGALPEAQSKPSRGSHRANKLAFFNAQITKHGRDGNIREAERIFSRIPNKDAICYTSMITAYAENGKTAKARKLFDELPDKSVSSYNAMVSAYFKRQCMVDEAFELFSKMPERNAVSYCAMMKGFVQAGLFDEAEKLYSEIPVQLRDPVCSSMLFQGYLRVGKLEKAFSVFDAMVERDVISWSSMVDGFCKAGKVSDARSLFDAMPEKNVVSWTSMIDGYMKDGNFRQGFSLFRDMRRDRRVELNPNTLSVIFGACGSFSKRKEGFQVHGLVMRIGLKCDGFLGNSMLTMYGKFGCMDSATKLFRVMNTKDVVSWSSLISGFVQRNDMEQALKFFEMMPNKKPVDWKTMISRLCSKGMIPKAVELFQTIPEKNILSWTAIVSGHVENKDYEEAFRCFNKLRREGIEINPRAVTTILGASSGLSAIKPGSQIHALVIKTNMESDSFIQNALITMYSSSGNLRGAREVFVGIESPSTVSFNLMITGLAKNGFGAEALELFEKMRNQGCEPDEMTFVGVLWACADAGLVEQGRGYFDSMKALYNVEATPDHYACMADLLGRAGLLDEALELVYSMPTQTRSNLPKLAAQNVVDFEPETANLCFDIEDINKALSTVT